MRQCAPFVPHTADELWSQLGNTTCLYKSPWPDFDPEVCREEQFTLVVQVNGKIRDRIAVPVDSDDKVLQEFALGSTEVAQYLQGKEVQRVIVVSKKLVNFVVK